MKALPLNSKTTVKVVAIGQDLKLFFNGTMDSSVRVSAPRISGDAYLYVSNPWYAPASATISPILLEAA